MDDIFKRIIDADDKARDIVSKAEKENDKVSYTVISKKISYAVSI
ncbi:MAG: hypothetical protein PUC88_06650 [Clostridia bacterium]|nr:hypothetical protein [Clostridia bacterium]